MDNFKEEIVFKRGGKVRRVILLALTYILLVIFGLGGFVMGLMPVMNMDFSVASIVALLIGGGGVWFLWRYKDTLDIEYEYTFTNGEMDFAQVLAQKRRKHLLTLRLKDVEVGGRISGDQYKRYSTMRDVKTLDFTLNDSEEIRFLFYIRDGNKHLLTFEPSEAMWKLITKTNARIQADAGVSR